MKGYISSQDLLTLPLSPVIKSRLHNAGYIQVQDLVDVSRDRLSTDTGCSTEDCSSVLDLVKRITCNRPRPRSAWTRLEEEQREAPIVTFVQHLDEALAGGVQCGRLTEICGVPGAGKTQLCLQLACDVQIPALFGGPDGEAVYIDTQGGLIVDRLTDIARATVRHCQYIAQAEGGEGSASSLVNWTEEKLLSRIHIFRCGDVGQMLAAIHSLPKLIEENKRIKLVIVDSVSFHFRHDFDDLSLRTRVLTNLAQSLISLATRQNIAVVVTNQMTTKVRQGSEKGSWLVPCLGESWGHACTCRLILEWEGQRRTACLYKSPDRPPARVPLQITRDGVRDDVGMSAKGDNKSGMSAKGDNNSGMSAKGDNDVAMSAKGDNNSGMSAKGNNNVAMSAKGDNVSLRGEESASSDGDTNPSKRPRVT